MDAPFVFSEPQLIEAEGSCIMGNTGIENISVAQGKARENALQKASEQAGVFISSVSVVKDSKLTKDEIVMLSASILKVVEDTSTNELVPNVPDAIRYKCHIKAWVDPDEFVKKFTTNITKEKIENQVIMNQDQETYKAQNEAEIIDLREQYKNAADENKRQEIVVAIKHNEEKVTAAQLYKRGAECYSREEYDKAIDFYNQAIAMDSKYAAPWTGLGLIYNDQGKYAKAIECFQKSIERYDGFAVPYNGLGYAKNESGDHNKAIEYLNKAIELNPKYAAAWNNLGYAYKYINKVDKAMECYNKAIATDPNDAAPLVNIGTVYYEQKNFQKATEYYQKSIAINPNFVTAWHNLGHIHYQKGEFEKAIDSYKKVTSLEPKNTRAWDLLGYAYNQQKKFEKAKDCFKKVIKIDPNDAVAWYGLGFAYDGSEDYSNSYEAYKKAVELEPNNENYKKNLEIAKKKI